jgi:Undecaprenyl-phosphate glucose phosphotransferase
MTTTQTDQRDEDEVAPAAPSPDVGLAPAPAARRADDLLFGQLTRWRVMFLTQVLDVVAIIALATLVYPLKLHSGAILPVHYLIGTVTIAAVSHFVFFHGRLYDMDMLQDALRSIRDLWLRWSVMFVMLAALSALAHDPHRFARTWFTMFYLGGLVTLGLERALVAKLIREWIRRGYETQRVAIVGGNELTAKLIEKFAVNPWGIRIIGVFDDRNRGNVKHITGVPRLGTVSDLLDYSKSHRLDLVVVTLPLAASQRIQAVIRQLRQQPVSVRVLPGEIGLEPLSPIRLARTDLPGVQLIAVADRPISEYELFFKGVFDRVAALLGLIVASPILLVCAAGIRISSPGPVFFRQPRVGYKGRNFEILKFRTMHVTAKPNTVLTMRDDPRVFRFGSLLRKTSLDEVPQLFNVLKGDMSLVGPRPHMPEARAAGRLYYDAVQEYADRQRVKPGITGWAQVNGWRGPTETLEQIERRVEHDIYYIDNWSLLLDFFIIFKTILVGFHGKNAF